MSDPIEVEDHLARVLSLASALPAGEMALDDSAGSVLAEPVVAAVDVPVFTNSAMDGFAVRLEDVASAHEAPATLPVAGDTPAGAGAPPPIAPGTCVRVMTGAPVPGNAEAVIPVEDTDIPAGPHALPNAVTFSPADPVKAGANIRRRGEDVASGDEILPAGTVMGALEIGAAASVNVGTVIARPRPRVAIVVTGSELAEPGTSLRPGQIPESNGHLLRALATEAGAAVVSVETAHDTVGEVADALSRAAAHADLVVTSGGVSAGAFDVAKEFGIEHGFTFSKVKMQPGKPQGSGLLDGGDGRAVPCLMLPGNPVSAWLSFVLFALPMLDSLQGMEPRTPEREDAQAGRPWVSPKGRRQYIVVQIAPNEVGGKRPQVVPLHRLGSGSHLAATLPKAQAVAIVPATANAAAPGDGVKFFRLSGGIPASRR